MIDGRCGADATRNWIKGRARRRQLTDARDLYKIRHRIGALPRWPSRVLQNLAAMGRGKALKVEGLSIRATAEVLGKGIARYGRRLGIGGGTCLLASALVACASLGGVTAESPPEVKQAAATERAKARWQALIAEDINGSYGFLTAASRKVVSLDAYKARARLSGFRVAEIKSVTCEAEMCNVTVIVTYDHRLMKGIKAPVDESWVLENGQYWYVWPL